MAGKRVAVLTVVCGVIAAMFGAVPSATAVTPRLACLTGNQNQTYSPGIVLLPRDVTVTGSGQYSSCSSSDGRNITTGSFNVSGRGTASCLAASLPTLNTVSWTSTTGERYNSVMRFNSGVDLKPVGQSVVVITGEVVSGLYEGRMVEKTIILTNANLLTSTECLNLTGEGLVASGGPVQLAIL
ncbi:hypothetical protein [Streptomyces lavendulocolor]|uniref:hypothetical protein n=1 Tax=Streptomyces lavendulocolor TaxID=67316 RepID=UPI003C301667